MHAADLLTSRARLTPERVALVELAAGRRHTYAELNARANRAANFLRARYGVQKGDRVALLAHNSVIYLDLLYGLAKIGAIFAPLNWRLTAHELTYIVQDCAPAVLICGPEFTEVLAEMRPALTVPHYLGAEGAVLPDAAYEAELAAASAAEPERPPLSGDDLCCLLYTSGTTGRPKGAGLPQRQVLWNCINTVISWGLREDDISPALTPLFHAGGLFAFLTPILYVGGRVVLARTFEPEASLRAITAEACTVILGVPTLFQMWLAAPGFAQADFSRVRFFINGGAPIPAPLVAAWRAAKGVVMRQGYGLTEAGVNCFSMTDAEAAAKPGSVGKPIFHSQARLVDPATGLEAAAGELQIAGPHVCAGYWRNPAATAEALRDGWFHTGDMAHRDAEGFYYIVGRYKDMLKSGGENVYAAEVEAVFREHPAVADAALIGQPDEKWGEVGLMVVVRRPDQAASEADLLAFCQSRLAKFKIPKRVIFTDGLPYSPYGKVEKVKLRERYL
ncbi:MAG: long-chain fatty acid--CoA ligase [Anaerolineales bacterium]|nr:long-chain fatty acid--CoA ligase [Anaerolineales bacterium]